MKRRRRSGPAIEEIVERVKTWGVKDAVVDESAAPLEVKLICEKERGVIRVTIDQVRALVRRYLLPVHVIEVLAPYLGRG